MIETERLELVPLTAHELNLWTDNMPQLEKELGCRYKAEPMQGMFLEIVKGQLAATEQDEKNFMWHSFWLIIRKEDRTVVGSADFKDIPDEKGEAEIGYGLGKDFEHKGYMSEAVSAMCEWALKQHGVNNIIAETECDNFKSHNVLKRCGFNVYKKGETLWWKLLG